MNRDSSVVLETPAATRAWVLRLASLVAAGAAVALLGGDPFGWVVGGVAATTMVALPRSFATGPFVVVTAVLLLRLEPPDPLVLAAAVLAVHTALALALVGPSLPLRALVSLGVLRSGAPTFLVAQGVGQGAAALSWLMSGATVVLPWLAVAAVVAVTGLGWWLLRLFPRAGSE